MVPWPALSARPPDLPSIRRPRVNGRGKGSPIAANPPQEKKKTAKNLIVPDYLKKALAKNKKAQEVFENFSPTNKNEYVEWLTDAKTDETRKRRLETAIDWISQGKPRMWKYMKK